jgi:multisubunit Na+/H+ antiporter MnhE subunit
MLIYVLSLYWDILVSGLSLTRRVLSPDMRLRTGIVAISTQDANHDPLILALSANYISLTPGELVVEVRDDHMMYVHCLDVDASAAVLEAGQARRLELLRRILGEMR